MTILNKKYRKADSNMFFYITFINTLILKPYAILYSLTIKILCIIYLSFIQN